MNFDKMTDLLHHLVDDLHIPSVCMQIYHAGQPVYTHAYGSPEGVPVTPQSTYNLYSVSKVITCTAALQLLERGKYLLTDPLYEYFPQFRELYVRMHDEEELGARVARGETVCYRGSDAPLISAKNPILIRNLFNMSAGFSYHSDAPAFREILQEEGGKFPTLRIADALAKEPLLYDPGTRWDYSLAHDMLGAFIERVSGMPFSTYVQKNIFEPLGMRSFCFARKGQVPDSMVPQYRYNYDTGLPERIDNENSHVLGEGFESGGAGLIGSVEDYAKFANAMCLHGAAPDGTRILAPATVDLMRTDLLTDGNRQDFNWPHLRGYGYGLGVRTHVNPAESGALSSIGEFGWGGAAGSYVLIDPDKQFALFYGQHMLNNLEPYVHPRLRNVAYACLEQ